MTLPAVVTRLLPIDAGAMISTVRGFSSLHAFLLPGTAAIRAWKQMLPDLTDKQKRRAYTFNAEYSMSPIIQIRVYICV